ncbi:folate ECF transporter [Leuconostoc litchii]|uniref:Folate family ECF transporter S component n=1 Tax=Leuconostoc litchii TaxID=1981069 RepID=A0A6P2CJU9_9LACO|nr:folate family ECF transporter S component [Leuconostoc litchii]TYC46115.1 folate family ECF transporter S component [Leuconostoc litchii]GMA69798.1 folate ECF transporter [Leuconostoc litchii]
MENTTRMWVFPKLDTRQFVVLALLMALHMVLSRLTVGTNVLQVSFAFVTMSLIAKWYGPLWAMLIAAVLDIVGVTIINPGAFFIGFTLTAVVSALIYSVAYFKHDFNSWVRVMVAVGLVSLVTNIGLNSIWLVLMYHTAHDWSSFLMFITPRVIKNVIMFPIQVGISYFLLNSPIVKHTTKQIFS